MANTPKEKFKNHSRFCALVAFLSLSSAPLLASSKIEEDEKPSVRGPTSYMPANLLEKARKIALFIADEKEESESGPSLIPQSKAVVALNEELVEDTSRALVMASPGFSFSFSNPITALTGYVKEVDWRKIALFILDEEDSDAKKTITVSGSGEEQPKVNGEEEGDKENEDRSQDRDHSFRQSDASLQSDGAHTPRESESDSEDEDKKPVHTPLAGPENKENSELGEEVQGELDGSSNASDNHDSVDVSDDVLEEEGSEVQQGSDVSSLAGEGVQGELDGSSNASDNHDSVDVSDDVLEEEGSEVQQGSDVSSLVGEEVLGELLGSSNASDNHDSVDVSDDVLEEEGSEEDDTFLNRRSKKIAAVALDSPTTKRLTEEKGDKKSGRSPYQSPKKKAVAPTSPKTPVKKITVPVAPKTPEQAGFRDKTRTSIGPLYNGLLYKYQNPKGETKIVTGNRLAYFVGNSPHPNKFVLVEAQSPIKPRAVPFSIKFPDGVAKDALGEDSSEASDSGSSSNDGSSDVSDSASSSNDGSSDVSDSASSSDEESSDESNSDKVDTK